MQVLQETNSAQRNEVIFRRVHYDTGCEIKMATQEAGVQGGAVARLKKFVREVRAELKKVTWPTRNELVSYTGIVFVAVIIVSLLIAGIDFVYSKLLQILLA